MECLQGTLPVKTAAQGYACGSLDAKCDMFQCGHFGIGDRERNGACMTQFSLHKQMQNQEAKCYSKLHENYAGTWTFMCPVAQGTAI